MLILGIETSCDDTSAAVVEDGCRIISNIVSSQDDIHGRYGGIVPELASRRHIEMIVPVVREAMSRAGAGFGDISAVAVTHGPGLIGSLLVGVCFAKSLSFVHHLPLIAVNHLEGHIYSVFLEAAPEFPFIALVVSGGHTSIYIVKGFGMYTEVARTRDDAAGEAYDKVSKLLGSGYPGGPVIDKMASQGNPEAIVFPRARLKKGHDFSFSGLKTAVLNHIRKHPESRKEDIAAGFQASVVDVLTDRVMEMAGIYGINTITLSGGVSANSSLRQRITERASEKGMKVYLPSPRLCTDNAAMTAAAGYRYFLEKRFAGPALNPKAYLPLGAGARPA